jgi:osmotically-inducible protein OsmY
MATQNIGSMLTMLIASASLGGCALSNRGAAPPKDDARITESVKSAIAQHPDLAAPNLIWVQTREHVVYLTGTVGDGLSRDNAVSVASAVPGVVKVVDEIAVSR